MDMDVSGVSFIMRSISACSTHTWNSGEKSQSAGKRTGEHSRKPGGVDDFSLFGDGEYDRELTLPLNVFLLIPVRRAFDVAQYYYESRHIG